MKRVLGLAMEVIRGFLRLPGALARVALAFRRDDGWIAGSALVSALSQAQRGRAAAGLLNDAGVVVTFERDGTTWSIPSGDQILPEMLARGRYESDEVPALVRWASTRSDDSGPLLVVEVGANVGTTTLPLCRAGARVIAVEPIARLRKLLETNLAQNGVAESVTIVGCAISNIEGITPMRLSDSGGSELVTRSEDELLAKWGPEYLEGRRSRGVETTVEVEARRLGTVLSELNVEPRDVGLVWSDTEGAEMGVVESAPELWRAGVPLWLEIWPVGIAEHTGVDRAFSILGEHFSGFVSRDDLMAGGSDSVPQPLAQLRALVDAKLATAPPSWSTDVLLVPKER